jgi:hypothetical protein
VRQAVGRLLWEVESGSHNRSYVNRKAVHPAYRPDPQSDRCIIRVELGNLHAKHRLTCLSSIPHHDGGQ